MGFNPPKGETPQVTKAAYRLATVFYDRFNPPKGETPQVTGPRAICRDLRQIASRFNPPKGETPQVTVIYTRISAEIVGFNPPKGETPQVTLLYMVLWIVSIPQFYAPLS